MARSLPIIRTTTTGLRHEASTRRDHYRPRTGAGRKLNEPFEGDSTMMIPARRRPTAVLRNFPETRWDVDRLFDEFFVRPMVSMNPSGPQADFYETEEEFVLEMNLPGMTEDEIDVNLEQGVLSITGEHVEEQDDEKGTYHLRERSWNRFTRSFSIPHTIDAEHVDAGFAKGVLTVRLPKAAEAKARRIEIKGG